METAKASTSASLARLLRVVCRVRNLDQSVRFYTECFDMKLQGTYECPLKQYAAALMGYGSSSTHFILELRFYFDIVEFTVGTGFGHIGINVRNVQKSLEFIESKGGKVTKEAMQVKGASTTCAFVEDPNGYEIELLQRVSYGDPFCQVMLRVVDLQSAITFYEKSFGMKLLRKFQLEVSKTKFELAFMGFGPEDETSVLELNSICNVAHYDKGNAYLELVIGVDDVESTYECIIHAGGSATKVAEDNQTKALRVFDLERWKTVVVDAKSKELAGII